MEPGRAQWNLHPARNEFVFADFSVLKVLFALSKVSRCFDRTYHE